MSMLTTTDGRGMARVDLIETPAGLRVSKFCPSWVTPFERLVKPDLDLEDSIAYLVEHGYSVRRWPGGARAWYGEPWPVRSKAAQDRLRDDLRRSPRPELEGVELDLAYDL